MSEPERDLPLLNIYEVDTPEGVRHYVGFQDQVLAGAVGLASHAMVGEFRPGPDGEFDPATFQLNPEFLDSVRQFMNAQPGRSPAIAEAAALIPGERLYIVDPRDDTPDDQDPPPADVLGWFRVDDAGAIVAESFEYNQEHLWFNPAKGVSGMLEDRTFYTWMHPDAHRKADDGDRAEG